jgi:hypothetical protein
MSLLFCEATPDPKKGKTAKKLYGEHIGNILSKVQSTIISAGNECETLIMDKVPDKKIIFDLDIFLRNIPIYGKFIWYNCKRYMNRRGEFKNPKILKGNKGPDFILFDCDCEMIIIIEHKLNDEFDTKKLEMEMEKLKLYSKMIGKNLKWNIKECLCIFQGNKDEIFQHLKSKYKKITIDNVMVDDELFSLLGMSGIKLLEDRLVQKNCQDFCKSILEVVREDHLDL